MVSAVSPDWDIGMQSVRSFTMGSRYLNSDPRSTSTGILPSSSNRNFPTNPECQDVPQATMKIFSVSRILSLEMGRSSIMTPPDAKSTLPASVSSIARGCSKISFCMKCLYPSFSAIAEDHSM